MVLRYLGIVPWVGTWSKLLIDPHETTQTSQMQSWWKTHQSLCSMLRLNGCQCNSNNNIFLPWAWKPFHFQVLSPSCKVNFGWPQYSGETGSVPFFFESTCKKVAYWVDDSYAPKPILKLHSCLGIRSIHYLSTSREGKRKNPIKANKIKGKEKKKNLCNA